ncbi:MAG: hypothetical protein JWM68_5367 [Verrucomicrobiales bacterium]|nr:hypothetical protein [Verrucomicrobiales bacterium]
MTPLFATVDPWILSFSLVTVIATIVMGFWSARKAKTASDFFVAGRSVSVGWNASAISGEYLSAASFMGIAGMVMSSGYDALWYPVCYACGYLFLLLFIAGPLRRFGAYTIPDFAEGRFDSPLFRKIAVIFVLFIGFFYTMPQMKGAGTTLAYIFQGLDFRGTFFEFLSPHDEKGALIGLNYSIGVIIVGAVITFNVALGGMKGITLVQAFQYWIKVFAISVPVFVLMSVYGHYGKQLALNIVPIGAPIPAVAKPAPTAADYKFVSVDATFAKTNYTLEELLKSSSDMKAGASSGNNVTANISSMPTVDFLKLYQQASGRFPFVLEGTPQRISTALRLQKVPPAEFVRTLESALGSNQIALITFNAATLVVPSSRSNEISAILHPAENASAVSTNVSSQIASGLRKPLPEKAPKDAAWVSPFGPLTTKAAKAAKLSPEESKPLSLLYTYSLIIALVCGTAGLPHILVRFYTNPDGVAAKRTTMWVMILIGVFYVFPPVLGVIGRNFMPELYTGTGAKGTDKIVLELPRMLNERVPLLGSILSGIACAGAFAAFMSTFSGLLVSMTGAMAHDVYGRMLRPNSTPQQRMKAFKIAAFGIGAVSVLLGMQVEQLQINFMVGQAFAIAAASYFPLLFMAIWWRGLTMIGAATGMLTGGLMALLGISLTSFSDLASAPNATKFFTHFAGLNPFWATHPLLRILCEQPAIWAVPLAIILMIIVSKLTKQRIPADIRMKMLVLHAPEKLGLKQEYIQEHQSMH